MWTCPKCREEIEDQFDSCWKCAGGGELRQFSGVLRAQVVTPGEIPFDSRLTIWLGTWLGTGLVVGICFWPLLPLLIAIVPYFPAGLLYIFGYRGRLELGFELMGLPYLFYACLTFIALTTRKKVPFFILLFILGFTLVLNFIGLLLAFSVNWRQAP